MREYFVPYFVPENTGQKTSYKMREYYLPVQLSAEISGT